MPEEEGGIKHALHPRPTCVGAGPAKPRLLLPLRPPSARALPSGQAGLRAEDLVEMGVTLRRGRPLGHLLQAAASCCARAQGRGSLLPNPHTALRFLHEEAHPERPLGLLSPPPTPPPGPRARVGELSLGRRYRAPGTLVGKERWFPVCWNFQRCYRGCPPGTARAVVVGAACALGFRPPAA